jgi:hypothetical protein
MMANNKANETLRALSPRLFSFFWQRIKADREGQVIANLCPAGLQPKYSSVIGMKRGSIEKKIKYSF